MFSDQNERTQANPRAIYQIPVFETWGGMIFYDFLWYFYIFMYIYNHHSTGSFLPVSSNRSSKDSDPPSADQDQPCFCLLFCSIDHSVYDLSTGFWIKFCTLSMWMKDDTECMIDNIRKRTKTTCSQHNKERCRKHQVRFFLK